MFQLKLIYIQGVQEKMCFFLNSLQPLPRCKRPSKLNAMRVYSHSYWLVIFCTTNSSRLLARERWQIVENSWKNTIFNEHPVFKDILIPQPLITQMNVTFTPSARVPHRQVIVTCFHSRYVKKSNGKFVGDTNCEKIPVR